VLPQVDSFLKVVGKVQVVKVQQQQVNVHQLVALFVAVVSVLSINRMRRSAPSGKLKHRADLDRWWVVV
jgi:hypothetical protein